MITLIRINEQNFIDICTIEWARRTGNYFEYKLKKYKTIEQVWDEDKAVVNQFNRVFDELKKNDN